MARLVLEGLAKSFGRTPVLHGIDLALDDAEMLVIVGASGSGKSTLLRLVAGLEAPSAGVVRLEGRDITGLDPAARDIAMVFQNYALYPHMSVYQNMAYALRVRRLPRAEIRRRVEQTAAMLGLSPLLGRRPRELSGGQRQRVAMGRAIVREPLLFLFDEPLSNLDAGLRVQMRAEILRLQRRLGVTSLYVTHDQVEAMTLADRLLVLHEGRSAQIAPPMEVFARPADIHVARLIGAPAMNLLQGVLLPGAADVRLDGGLPVRLAAPLPLAPGAALMLGIRPEHVAPLPDGLKLAVELVERLGSEAVVHGVLQSGAALSMRLAGAAPGGGALAVGFPPALLHVFDAGTGRRVEAVAGEITGRALAGAGIGR